MFSYSSNAESFNVISQSAQENILFRLTTYNMNMIHAKYYAVFIIALEYFVAYGFRIYKVVSHKKSYNQAFSRWVRNDA